MAHNSETAYLNKHVKPCLNKLLRKACAERPTDVRAFLRDNLTISDRAVHLDCTLVILPGMEAKAKAFCNNVLYAGGYRQSLVRTDGQNVIAHRASIESLPDGTYCFRIEEFYDTHRETLMHMAEYEGAMGDNLATFATLGDLAGMKAEFNGPQEEMELLSDALQGAFGPRSCCWHLRTSYRPSRPALKDDDAVHYRIVIDIKPGKSDAFWRAVHQFRQIHQRVMGEAAGTTHFGFCSDGGSRALLREGYSAEGMAAYFKIMGTNSEYAAIHTRVLEELGTINIKESNVTGPVESLRPLMKAGGPLAPFSAAGLCIAMLAGGLRRAID